MKLMNEKGMTLVEMMVAGAISVAVVFFAMNLKNFTEKENTRLQEDIQSTISRYGGAMVLMRDLTFAEPSFNFLNTKDDNGLPFFVLATNELCSGKNCERRKTLEIPKGKLKSDSIILIVRKGYLNEMLKFTIDPISTYDSRSYSGINWQYNNADMTISKSIRPYSPWAKDRLLMLTSELSFYDCKNMVEKDDGSCRLTCGPSGGCNYVAKRHMQFLGIVNNNESDLNPVTFSQGDLIQNKYLICRPDSNMKCNSYIDITRGLDSSKTFFEMLPYMPGLDNRSYISPVEVIEYYLQKKSDKTPDHEIQLIRSRLKVSGNKLVHEAPRAIITGVTSIQFKRANISNALIEYKLKKARFRNSVK